ncbi:hypothetical protein ACP3V5_17400 [Vibrio maritimus]|jgi:hypothetical protein
MTKEQVSILYSIALGETIDGDERLEVLALKRARLVGSVFIQNHRIHAALSSRGRKWLRGAAIRASH